MKKYIKLIALITALTIGVSTVSSCYGKFLLTRKLYTWNGTVGNKFVNSLVMWVLMIVQVYSIVGFVDFVILNTVEFWTGNNPMSMKAGDREVQVAEVNGVRIQMTATQNRMDIEVLSGPDAGKKAAIVYQPDHKAWYLESETAGGKVAQWLPDQDRIVEFMNPVK